MSSQVAGSAKQYEVVHLLIVPVPVDVVNLRRKRDLAAPLAQATVPDDDAGNPTPAGTRAVGMRSLLDHSGRTLANAISSSRSYGWHQFPPISFEADAESSNPCIIAGRSLSRREQ